MFNVIQGILINLVSLLNLTHAVLFFSRCFPKVCESTKLSCDEGAKCLPLTWVCDSINDCNDNKDEHNCPNRRTGEDVFTFYLHFNLRYFFILSSKFQT